MANRPLYGQQIKYGSTDAQRQAQMAQLLLKEGVNTSPVQGGWGEALARVGTAGIGGYLSNQAGETEKTYQSDRAKTMAAALSGDPSQAAASLMANPSTADMGANLALNNMQFNQQRAAQREDTTAGQNFQKEMAAIQQAFQSNQMTAQQAFAAQQAAQQRAHAAGLQTNAQQFQSGQTTAQQTFQAAENEKNRAAQTVPAGFRPAEGGAMAPIPGGPADPAYLGQKTEATTAAKMNDEQAKAAGFADRITASLPIIKQTTSAGTDLTEKGRAALPLFGNYAVSDDYQKFDQAKRDVINSILRRESGAVISKEEFSNADKQYFPQPGDSKEVLAQKETNLQAALAGMQRSAGPAYKPPQPKPAATNTPKTGDVMDGYKFKGGNPSDPNSWEKQ
jgi:hypothetical protein